MGSGWRGAPLLRALGSRSLAFIATLFGAGLLLHGLLLLAPGDPIDLIPDGEANRAELAVEFGLDRPPLERLIGGTLRALTGDLGPSLIVAPGTPVTELVRRSCWRSLMVVGPALPIAMLAGLGAGLLTAGRSSALRGLIQIIGALPVFLLAWALVTTLNAGAWSLIERGVLERPDWFALPDQDSPLRTALAIAAVVLGSGTLFEVHAACEAEILRLRRSELADAITGLGLPLWPVLLRNLAPGLLTVARDRVAFLVGGLVVVEKVLLMGGAGALLWQAALARDYPLAIGLGVAAATVVAGSALVADALRLLLDPRARAEGA